MEATKKVMDPELAQLMKAEALDAKPGRKAVKNTSLKKRSNGRPRKEGGIIIQHGKIISDPAKVNRRREKQRSYYHAKKLRS